MWFALAIILAVATLSSGAPHSLPQVKFFQFSETGKTEVKWNDLKYLNTKLDQSVRKIKILSHGWMGNIHSDWYDNTASRYLRNGQPNIFAIDWSHFAVQQYQDAVVDSYKVGEYIGGIVFALHKQTGFPLEDIHLIGHSLGAHVMGMVGQYIAEVSGTKIGRITGLDPAGPSFDSTHPIKRLSLDDAYFVDIIHTNTLAAGYKKSLGHVDFWPNGGRDQIGCNGNFGCSHGRAPEFFAESINAGAFPSWYCDSIEVFKEGKCFENTMIYMGDMTPTNVRGNFYLTTNAVSPFGMSVEAYGIGK